METGFCIVDYLDAIVLPCYHGSSGFRTGLVGYHGSSGFRTELVAMTTTLLDGSCEAVDGTVAVHYYCPIY